MVYVSLNCRTQYVIVKRVSTRGRGRGRGQAAAGTPRTRGGGVTKGRGGRGRGRGGRGRGRGGRGRGYESKKKLTAEALDAEMDSYFMKDEKTAAQVCMGRMCMHNWSKFVCIEP